MDKITKSQVKLVRSLQQKKFRDETGLFVAEGEKCVSELSKAFELVYRIESTEYRPATPDRTQTDILLASQTEIEQMSGLKTPQGVIGVFKKRTQTDILFADDLILALDGIQDPGNLGTIIRTADWFGVKTIICSKDTADCYNPKVVQATMGSLARVSIHYVDLPKWLEEYRAQTVSLTEHRPIYGTLLEGKNMYEVLEEQIKNEKLKIKNSIIIMGNEGNGISEAVRKYITHPILIPPYNNEEAPESLNVAIATAIVLAEFRR